METVYRVMDALLPFELFRYAFMKNALLALLLLTPLLALLGTMAVNQRMAFFLMRWVTARWRAWGLACCWGSATLR